LQAEAGARRELWNLTRKSAFLSLSAITPCSFMTDSKAHLARASTGIEGLDAVLFGGFTRNRLHLLEGSPGTGKTTVALQLVRTTKWSWLKAWAMTIARRRGLKRAIVALARRLAVIMHRIWVDGTEFRWTRETAAA
jgi:predicted ATP-dependent serine protease